MADKRLLTDRYLKSSSPARRRPRDKVWTAALTGFGVRRLTDHARDGDPARRGKAGRIIFVLRARFPSSPAPTRRTIGTYSAITLEDARRSSAGEWRSLIAKGVDPAVVEAEARKSGSKPQPASAIPWAAPPRRSSPTS